MQKSNDEIVPLTGLRFVAALYVFVFHMNLRWPVAKPSGFVSNLISQGAVGMSLFFILSGFLLAYRYGDGRGGYREFVVNRFSRIYPVYLVAALLTLPWLGINFDASTWTGAARQALSAIALLAIDAAVLQAWFPQLFELWNNGGSWSISVEVFCYALLPLILARVQQLDAKGLRILLLSAYVLATLPGVCLTLFYGQYGLAFYSMPIFRLPEFVMGVCAAVIASRTGSPGSKAIALQLIGLVSLIAYLGLVGARLPMWISHNWIVLPVIALTVYTTAQSAGFISKVLAWRPLVWSGKVSYCFYSFQLFILLFLKSHHVTVIEQIPVLADNRLLLALAFVILMVMSAAGYYLIEEPARIAIKRFSKRRVGGVSEPAAAAL